MTTIVDEARLRASFERAGQGHVFAFAGELDPEQRAHLFSELAQIDLALVGSLAGLARKSAAVTASPRFEPPAVVTLAQRTSQAADLAQARAQGADLLASGGVAYLLVAGGQASRLGYDGPKGAFPVGPVSDRSLFEIFARRLIAARDRHGARTSWYVMTSRANDRDTRDFFARNAWFGLRADDVFFFSQAMLPALDERGRILMAAKHAPFMAPNGHGGTLSALASSGALEHARDRGVRTFSYFQVDNPLALPADPLFLGLHARAGAQMSSKVVKKRDAAEKVGVLGKVDGALSCIEYSDLPAHLREARDATGELVFGAGNIALHALERTFVEELTRGQLRLPWHVARKSIPALDAAGNAAAIQGFKFETFVFDALMSAQDSVTLEVDRALEFSPVKNATGEDSSQTARAAQCRLFASWAERAGLPLPPRDEHGLHPVEVDPCVAEDAETFLSRAPHTPRVNAKGHFYA